MPWKETCVMDLKMQFIADWLHSELWRERSRPRLWDQPEDGL